MDRFASSEILEWNPGAFEDGFKARQAGFSMLSQNKHEPGSWAFKSFNAGWADADMDDNCPKDEVY